MISPPRGTVFLCKSPLSQDNEHQIQFYTSSEQQSYFNSLEGISLQYNYVRNEGFIMLPIDYYTALQYNYLIFQNTYVNNKWFFCFIDSIKYINDKVTNVYIKTDVYQTYLFDIELNPSFIERRHEFNLDLTNHTISSSDTMNTINDNVSEGDLIIWDEEPHNFGGVYLVFCNADVTHLDLANATLHNFKMGNFQLPCMVLCYKLGQENLLNADLQCLANNGVSDRINSAIFLPCIAGNEIYFNVDEISSDIISNTLPVCSGINDTALNDFLKSEISYDFTTYVNQLGCLKSLTFPYSKIVVQDMTTGQQIELQPDKFTNYQPTFEVQICVSETPSYRIIPKNYKGQAYAYSDSLVVRCNTSLPLMNNTYAKYLMNNQDLNNLKISGATVGIAGSLATGSAMGAMTGFESITSVMLQEQQAQRQPNQLTAITDGAMERILLQNGIKILFKSMDVNHLNSALNYWKMFGYPLKRMEIPTVYSYLDYQFIKTQNANIDGSIPQNDLIEIQNIFNKGCTFWKADKFRKY
jgi:hypothetical protein